MTLIKSNKNGNIFPSVFSDLFDNENFFDNRWFTKNLSQSLPAVNVKESPSEFSIEFAAPGFSKKDFKIDVDNNILSVGAEKKEEKNENEDRFTRKEFSYNSFTRSFTLPQTVDSGKIEAKYNDGILKLIVPKKEEAKTHPKKEITVA